MCCFTIFPAEYLRLFAFEILVDREEVFNLTENVRTDVRVILEFYIPRIPGRVGDDLLIADTVVQHLEQPNGTRLAKAPGKTGTVAKHKDVERVAILSDRLGDETIVARIVDWRMQVAVQNEDLQIEIILILVDTVLGDFDDRGDDIGRAIANGEFQIAVHFAPSP